MVRDNPDSDAVTGHWLSTAVPASMTVGPAEHDLSGVDLAMKLHYLRILYYFRPSAAVAGTAADDLKDPLFLSLDRFSHVAGRIRKGGAGAGRPQIKCNDSGVRVVEAACEQQTMQEWLEKKTPDRDALPVPDNVLGPELSFSPLLFVQFTRFKCGGLAVGFSWAHVLGDAVSALNFINLWGSLLSGDNPAQQQQQLRKSHHSPNPAKNLTATATGDVPLSLKRVELSGGGGGGGGGGDVWLPRTNHRMVTSSFKFTGTKLNRLRSMTTSAAATPAFEAIAALMWKTLAKIRAEKDSNLVTVIRKNYCSEEEEEEEGINTSSLMSNKHITISTVATAGSSSSSSSSSSPAELHISELAMLISSTSKDEKKAIGETLDRDDGGTDFIIYGANTTFVDMGGVDLYGLELNGQRPACVEYTISGVGDEGAVLVLQDPNDAAMEAGGAAADDGGKRVVVILPEHEMPKLKEALEREWGIVE